MVMLIKFYHLHSQILPSPSVFTTLASVVVVVGSSVVGSGSGSGKANDKFKI